MTRASVKCITVQLLSCLNETNCMIALLLSLLISKRSQVNNVQDHLISSSTTKAISIWVGAHSENGRGQSFRRASRGDVWTPLFQNLYPPLRLQGTIGPQCTAHMKVHHNKVTDKVDVEYCNYHHNRNTEIAHLRIPDDTRHAIAAQLQKWY